MAEVLRCDQCGQIAPHHDMTPRWWQLDAVGRLQLTGAPQNGAPYHFCSTRCLVLWAFPRREAEETPAPSQEVGTAPARERGKETGNG